MFTAIKLGNCSNASIINCGFHGMDIAVDSSGGKNLLLQGNFFSNVKTGAKIRNTDSVKAYNNTQVDNWSLGRYNSRLKPLVLAVKNYNFLLLSQGD